MRWRVFVEIVGGTDIVVEAATPEDAVRDARLILKASPLGVSEMAAAMPHRAFAINWIPVADGERLSAYACVLCGAATLKADWGPGRVHCPICAAVAPAAGEAPPDPPQPVDIRSAETDLVSESLRDPAVRHEMEYEWFVDEVLTQIDRKMKDLGIRRKDLASRLECSAANVSQLLRNGSNLTLKTLMDMALALNHRFLAPVLVPLSTVAPWDVHGTSADPKEGKSS